MVSVKIDRIVEAICGAIDIQNKCDCTLIFFRWDFPTIK